MPDIPKLRGHHLICLHFFSGKGYSREFIENLKSILKIIEEKDLEISDGADDVCGKCPYLRQGNCMYDENSDEEITGMDEFALKLLNKTPGMKTGWNELRGSVRKVFPSWAERYCGRCVWLNVCNEDPLYRALRDGKDPA